MRYDAQAVIYHPDQGTIGVLVQDELEMGSFYINLVEDDLPNPDAWTNEMVRAAAEAKLVANVDNEFGKRGGPGHVVVMPPRRERTPAPAPMLALVTDDTAEAPPAATTAPLALPTQPAQ